MHLHYRSSVWLKGLEGGPDRRRCAGPPRQVLANYLVSSASFVHPVSRRPLLRAEMQALDAYMAQHRLGAGNVTHVFDRKVFEKNKPNPEPHARSVTDPGFDARRQG